jgi:hypothetical protein
MFKYASFLGQPLASVQSTSKTCGEGEQLPAKGDEESMMD